ncbi:UbiA prenyltransferase family protein [Kribbella solani]|uniref:UbiA prenyltransferase family protein n=1 Tax=Kribbella solani TaxID=236067 RepID=UPI0029BC910F|nr:UbiA prenyltransferase family protein [Kribbella solani]MDX2972416.1 UbiA prenyltransferase family protein [Kribbella solani]MDX3007001.1 UbiA prenyltransferase family protein [Kribbella solani]
MSTDVQLRRTQGTKAGGRTRVRDVISIGRPAFWVVSVVPYYTGILLATRQLVPPFEEWPRLIIGAVVLGPLVWLAVLAVNDAYDLPSDRLNPRKSKSPLLDGRITLGTAKRLAFAAAVAAVGLSLQVGIVFALGVLLAVLLGYAYSVPPVRLKTRAGFDVAVNALALGAFGPLAGWAAINPDLSDFPWLMGLQGTLAAIGLYIPTTIADLEADKAAGYHTIAVRFGARTTYLIGYAAWIAAAILSVVLAATATIIPREMLPLELVMVPVLIAAYRKLIGPHQSFKGIITLATLFLFPCATFALTYTGVL